MRSPLLELFDAIYLVNLDRRPDRLETAQKTLFDAGITEFMRFPAIDGKKIDYAGNLNPGQLGCTLSHLFIVKKAIENGYKRIFIFEDDIELAPNFNEVFSAAFSELPTDWSMIYAGANHFRKADDYSANLVKLNGSFTTHAYGISSNVFEPIVAMVEGSYNKVIDDYYLQFIHPKHPCFCTKKKVAYQNEGYSDLLEQHVNYNGLLR